MGSFSENITAHEWWCAECGETGDAQEGEWFSDHYRREHMDSDDE